MRTAVSSSKRLLVFFLLLAYCFFASVSCTDATPKIKSLRFSSSSNAGGIPTVVSVSTKSSDGYYKAEGTILIDVTFSKKVILKTGESGTAFIDLNSSSRALQPARAFYVGQKDQAKAEETLTFQYTVQESENSSRLNYLSAKALVLEKGVTLQDESDQSADLNLPPLCMPLNGTCSNILRSINSLEQSFILVDTVKPSPVVIEKVNPLLTNSTAVSPVLIFSAKPADIDINQFMVSIYEAGETAGFNNAKAYNGNFVSGSQFTGLSLTDGKSYVFAVESVDKAGNRSSSKTFSPPWTINTTVPMSAVVTSVNTSKGSGFYRSGMTIDINIVFSTAVIVSGGTPKLRLNAGSSAWAYYASGSGSNVLSFYYTVLEGESTGANNLNYTNAAALELNGAFIRDGSGKAAELVLPLDTSNQFLSKNIKIDAIPPLPPWNIAVGTGGWTGNLAASPLFTFISGSDAQSGLSHHEVKVVNVTDSLDLTAFMVKVSGDKFVELNTLTVGKNYKFVFRSKDNAGNYSTEVSSSNWGVDLEPPSYPGSITMGAVPSLFKRQIPTLIFTDSTDMLSGLDFYQIEIRKASDHSVVKEYVNATGSGSGLSYYENIDLLTSGESYYVNLRAVDKVGNKGPSISSGVWVAFQCPTGFAAVSARAPYTSSPFCVSKYEMKLQYNGSLVADGNYNNAFDYDADYDILEERAKYMAVSTPNGRPWVNIKRGERQGVATGQGAVEACRNMGEGYDLISNAQWQTIAQSVELTASNWTSGVVGVEMMYQGHSDAGPNGSLSVSNVDYDYDQTGNGFEQAWGSGKEQRRTVYLPSGVALWDMSGNVSEWVKDNNITDFAVINPISQITDANYTVTGTVGGIMGTAKYLFGPSGTYTGLGIMEGYGGLGYGHLNGTAGGAILRGWDWGGSSSYSGVFSVNSLYGPSFLYNSIGFRCIFQ